MSLALARKWFVLSVIAAFVLAMLACGAAAPSEPTQPPQQESMAAATQEPAQMDQPTAAPEATSMPASQQQDKPADTAAGSSFKMQEYQGLTFKQFSGPPQMMIDPNASYTATITTNKGIIVIDLLAANAPKTVNNFVFLAEDGFYDGLIFHRVIENFMIQGGDPTGTGGAGPGYKFEDETSPSDSFDKPGILAMANSGPNTNGSQFFITTVPTPHLNGNHTIFGTVVKGQEVADAISKVEKDQAGRPAQPVIIESIKIAKSGSG